MSRYLDYACYFVFGIMVVVVASTFGIAYLDYLDRHEEYAERIDTSRDFHDRHCRDSSYLARFPQLSDECHESKHAAYDDPSKRALRDVLSRWSICDANGCDAFLDRFGRYFSLTAFIFALLVGAWCIALVYRVAGRRATEVLPEVLRN